MVVLIIIISEFERPLLTYGVPLSGTVFHGFFHYHSVADRSMSQPQQPRGFESKLWITIGRLRHLVH